MDWILETATHTYHGSVASSSGAACLQTTNSLLGSTNLVPTEILSLQLRNYSVKPNNKNNNGARGGGREREERRGRWGRKGNFSEKTRNKYILFLASVKVPNLLNILKKDTVYHLHTHTGIERSFWKYKLKYWNEIEKLKWKSRKYMFLFPL